MGARLAALQEQGLIPRDPPASTPADGTAALRAILPVYFANPRHPGAQTLNGATFCPRVYAAILEALGDFDLRARVSSLRMPSLTMIAAVPFGAEMAGEMADALRGGNARRILLPDCGHLPWAECPENFFAHARAFLAQLLAHVSPAGRTAAEV